MKYRNTINSYVPVGPRESVVPFGVTRDFTTDEISKNENLRHFVDRGILVEWDGKTPLPAPSAAATKAQQTKKAAYQPSTDTVDGEVKRLKTSTGKVVEYVSATDVGVDDVQTVDMGDGVVAAMDGRKPLEHIEEGMTPEKSQKLGVKPSVTWQSASDAYEKELSEESSPEEFDDNQVLADMEEVKEEIPDAETEIEQDYSRVLQNGGRMGATEVTTRQAVEEGVAAASRQLTEAVKPNTDDGEHLQGEASAQAAELLAQPFTTKKWAIAKETNPELLKEIASVTTSDNVRTLASQRLSELGEKAA